MSSHSPSRRCRNVIIVVDKMWNYSGQEKIFLRSHASSDCEDASLLGNNIVWLARLSLFRLMMHPLRTQSTAQLEAEWGFNHSPDLWNKENVGQVFDPPREEPRWQSKLGWKRHRVRKTRCNRQVKLIPCVPNVNVRLWHKNARKSYRNWYCAGAQFWCFTGYHRLCDAGPWQTNFNQYTSVYASRPRRTVSMSRTQDHSETALSHWLPAASRHSGVIRRRVREYANREGHVVSWSSQSGWAVRIR